MEHPELKFHFRKEVNIQEKKLVTDELGIIFCQEFAKYLINNINGEGTLTIPPPLPLKRRPPATSNQSIEVFAGFGSQNHGTLSPGESAGPQNTSEFGF